MTQPTSERAGEMLLLARRAVDERWAERDAGVELRLAIRTLEHSLNELQATLRQRSQEAAQHNHRIRRLVTQYYERFAESTNRATDQRDLLEAILLLEEKLMVLPPANLQPLKRESRRLIGLQAGTPVIWRNGSTTWEGDRLREQPCLRWDAQHVTPHWEIVLEGQRGRRWCVILPSLEFPDTSPLHRHLFVGRQDIEALFARVDLTQVTPAARTAILQALEAADLPNLSGL